MADRITPAERAMIDAAIARGEVTQCPPRTFALDPFESVPFSGGVSALFVHGDKRMGNYERMHRADMNAIMTPTKGKPRAVILRKAAARYARIIALADGTRCRRDIADDLGVTYEQISNDLRALERKGHYLPILPERMARARLAPSDEADIMAVIEAAE